MHVEKGRCENSLFKRVVDKKWRNQKKVCMHVEKGRCENSTISLVTNLLPTSLSFNPLFQNPPMTFLPQVSHLLILF